MKNTALTNPGKPISLLFFNLAIEGRPSKTPRAADTTKAQGRAECRGNQRSRPVAVMMGLEGGEGISVFSAFSQGK